MAGGIKGITVKIGGDTTELGKSLKEATTLSTSLQRELKGVNTLLKFDPKNVTLLKQKSDLLKESIAQTKQKLADLIEVQKKVDSGEIKMTEEEYRNLQREIANTQNKLKQLEDEQKNFGSVGAQRIKAMGESLKETGAKVEGVGKKFMPVSGAVTALGAAAVKTTADFDKSMSNVSAISGATGKDLEALRSKAREMGAQTKFSASESADAMSYMAMAGWKTSDMLNGISGVMNLAAASGEDLATTSDILTDGLTAFGLSAKDSSRMADVMAAASSNANTNVSLLGESYKYCASTAGAMGYSLEDVTESLGLMANAGVKGSQAGTSLKTAMINLAKPTAQMKKAMDQYGISITNSDGSMKSWDQVVANLRSSLGGLSEAQKTSAVATIFGKEATSGMLAVINAAPGDVNKLDKAISNSTGTAQKMADTMNNNLSGQITILKSQLQELAISFGELLMPIIRNVVSVIQNFVDKLNSMSNAQRTVVLVIAAIVAAIGPVLVTVGKLMIGLGQLMTYAPQIQSAFTVVKGVFIAFGGALKTAVISALSLVKTALSSLWGAMLSNPITIVIALIAALVAGLIYAYNHCETFRDAVNNAFSKIKEVVGNVVNSLVTFFTVTVPNAFNSFVSVVSSILNNVKAVFETVFNAVKNVVQSAINVIKTIMLVQFAIIMNLVVPILNVLIKGFTDTFNAIKTIVTTVWTAIRTATSVAWNAIKAVITPIINGIRTTISTVFNAIRSTVSTVSNTIKSVMTTAWNTIKSVTSTVWNGIKTAVTVPINAAKSLVHSAINGIKSTVSSVWNSIKSTTTSVWNGIKNAITSPITAAKNTVSNIIGTIKGIVKNVFNGIKPKLSLSLPHVSVDGGTPPWGIGGKGKLPSFNVKWNKLGAIFSKPTIFDTNQGLQGVGEAGPEAVAPIKVLQEYVADAVADRNQALENKLDTIITLMSAYYPNALDAMARPVTIGVDSIDNALSDKNNKVVRGW